MAFILVTVVFLVGVLIGLSKGYKSGEYSARISYNTKLNNFIKSLDEHSRKDFILKIKVFNANCYSKLEQVDHKSGQNNVLLFKKREKS